MSNKNKIKVPRIMHRISREKIGKAPGTLIYSGEKRSDKIKIQLIHYSDSNFEEREIESLEELFEVEIDKGIFWINIIGIHDASIIEKIGAHFKLHKLLLEDILNTGQRPKLEKFDDYLFLIMKMISHNERDRKIDLEQVSFILEKNLVISFQEKEGDVFNIIRNRIRDEKSKIRKLGSDYLIYSLMDTIIDNCFLVLEKIGEDIDSIEYDLINNPSLLVQKKIYKLKREVIFLRKSIWPLREIVSELQKYDSKMINKNTRIYLRDLYDHVIQLADTIETFRDIVSGMLDLYMTSVSHRMNEIMKVLTIISTIFIPLTFIAGIYGMNFEFMPELSIKWFYPVVLGSMAIIALLMMLYFRRKKWI